MSIEDAIEKAARAYEDAEAHPVMIECPRCKGKGYHHGYGPDGVDPDWCEHCGGPGKIEHPTHRMSLAIAAFLRAAEATPAMVSVGDQRGRQFFDMPANIAGEVWNAMRWVAADEVEGGGR